MKKNNIGFTDISYVEETKVINEEIITNKIYKNIALDSLIDITFDDCIFEKIRFNNIKNITFTNCKFINSDLSNITILNTSFHFVSIIDTNQIYDLITLLDVKIKE